MRQFIDVTGKTEDEAISRALEQLGLDRDDVSVEILERAKAGFLGLGSCPAKVRTCWPVCLAAGTTGWSLCSRRTWQRYGPWCRPMRRRC